MNLTKILWNWPKFYELDWIFMNFTKILQTWLNIKNLTKILQTWRKLYKLDLNLINLTEIWQTWLKYDKLDRNFVKLTEICTWTSCQRTCRGGRCWSRPLNESCRCPGALQHRWCTVGGCRASNGLKFMVKANKIFCFQRVPLAH